MINRHELFLPAYNEEQLKIKFIAPVLNRVDFFFDDIKDWYEYSLSATVNNTLLKGQPDFMLAKGERTPTMPYFFIQEFKPTRSLGDPKDQLLAELLAAMQINKKSAIHGAFIIGQYWKYLLLEKLETGNYEYFVSKSFDCLNFKDLKQIYINLQAVKILFCKD